MTSDVPRNDTEAVVPQGKYEQKRQEDLTKCQVAPQTDEKVNAETRSHTVHINTGSACGVRVVRIAVDVNLQGRKDMIAGLNERLRRLRSK